MSPPYGSLEARAALLQVPVIPAREIGDEIHTFPKRLPLCRRHARLLRKPKWPGQKAKQGSGERHILQVVIADKRLHRQVVPVRGSAVVEDQENQTA